MLLPRFQWAYLSGQLAAGFTVHCLFWSWQHILLFSAAYVSGNIVQQLQLSSSLFFFLLSNLKVLQKPSTSLVLVQVGLGVFPSGRRRCTSGHGSRMGLSP